MVSHHTHPQPPGIEQGVDPIGNGLHLGADFAHHPALHGMTEFIQLADFAPSPLRSAQREARFVRLQYLDPVTCHLGA